jgi:hypothetical protein
LIGDLAKWRFICLFFSAINHDLPTKDLQFNFSNLNLVVYTLCNLSPPNGVKKTIKPFCTMNTIPDFDYKRFILEEYKLASFQAGMQTRNKEYPVNNKLSHAISKNNESSNSNTLKKEVMSYPFAYCSYTQVVSNVLHSHWIG